MPQDLLLQLLRRPLRELRVYPWETLRVTRPLKATRRTQLSRRYSRLSCARDVSLALALVKRLDWAAIDLAQYKFRQVQLHKTEQEFSWSYPEAKNLGRYGQSNSKTHTASGGFSLSGQSRTGTVATVCLLSSVEAHPLSVMPACATVSRDARPHSGMPQMGGGRLYRRLFPPETIRSQSNSR